MQNPPPPFKWAWWYPPLKFIAHPNYKAKHTPSIVPDVAYNIGFNKVYLVNAPGKKNIGTSTN